MPKQYWSFPFIVLYLWSAPIWAEKYDITTAIQVMPILFVDRPEVVAKSTGFMDIHTFERRILNVAKRHFAEAIPFHIDTPANSLVVATATYGYQNGPFYNPDMICVNLRSEGNRDGVDGCHKNSGKAIRKAFSLLEEEHSKRFQEIQKSNRSIRWLELIDKGIFYNAYGQPTKIPVDSIAQSIEKKGHIKNIRDAVGQYFYDDDLKQEVKFYKSSDLIGATMSSKSNLLKHYTFVEKMLEDVPGRSPLLRFYMHRAIDIGAPIKLINKIGSRKLSYDEFLDSAGNTPFLHAAFRGNIELVELLLGYGSDIHWKNSSNVGAIHLLATHVARAGSFDWLDWGLSQGLNINDVGDNGEYPLSLALALNSFLGKEKISNSDLALGFLNRGSFAETPQSEKNNISTILLAALEGDVVLLRLLIDNGVNLVANPNTIAPVMQLVVEKRDTQSLRLLLESGANPNLVTSHGSSLLHAAYSPNGAKMSQTENDIVRMLIDFGADTDAKSSLGMTAKQEYEVARAAFENEEIRAAEALRKKELDEQRKIAFKQQQQRQMSRNKIAGKSTGFNFGKALALLAGSAIGGGTQLSTASQIEIISGIVQDSMPGQDGVSSTLAAITSSGAKYNMGNSQEVSQSSGFSPVSNAALKPNILASAGDRCSQNAQVQSMCQAANVYYNRYVELVSEGQIDPSEMYGVHVESAKAAMRYMQNAQKGGTILDLSKPSSENVKTKNESRSYSNTKKSECNAPSHSACVTPE